MTQADPHDTGGVEAGPLGVLIAYGLSEAERADYADFDVYVLTLADDLTPALRRAGGGAALDYPPQHALALVVAVPGQAGTATDWARAVGLDVRAVVHGPDTPALLASLARRVRRAARLAGEVTLRLAALRAAHENLQNAYEGLRAFIQERALLLPMLGFVALPDRDGSHLPPRLAEVTQYIPCDLRSLCAIGLHVAEPAAAGAQGVLEVALSSPENPALSLHWRVPYENLPAGWSNFVFEGIGAAPRSSAALRLRFRTLAGTPPAFSLARPHLRPDRVAVADGEMLARPLAFRAWTNIPGAPLTLTAQMWPAIQPLTTAAAALLPRIEILAGDDFEVEDVRRLSEKLDFQPVRKLPRQRRILIHPLGQLPSIGRIVRACPPGTLEIRAEVETDHAEAAVLEYGIALGDGPAADSFRFDGPSDWLLLPAKTPGTLLIRLDEPLAEAADLYLICRCPPGSTSDWGWAHFSRLTLTGAFSADAFAPVVETAG